MRLHPAVTKEEALEWLTTQATVEWGADRLPELEAGLAELADALADISTIELPDDLPPLYA